MSKNKNTYIAGDSFKIQNYTSFDEEYKYGSNFKISFPSVPSFAESFKD